jgi:hypothetical protein
MYNSIFFSKQLKSSLFCVLYSCIVKRESLILSKIYFHSKFQNVNTNILERKII